MKNPRDPLGLFEKERENLNTKDPFGLLDTEFYVPRQGLPLVETQLPSHPFLRPRRPGTPRVTPSREEEPVDTIIGIVPHQPRSQPQVTPPSLDEPVDVITGAAPRHPRPKQPEVPSLPFPSQIVPDRLIATDSTISLRNKLEETLKKIESRDRQPFEGLVPDYMYTAYDPKVLHARNLEESQLTGSVEELVSDTPQFPRGRADFRRFNPYEAYRRYRVGQVVRDKEGNEVTITGFIRDPKNRSAIEFEYINPVSGETVRRNLPIETDRFTLAEGYTVGVSKLPLEDRNLLKVQHRPPRIRIPGEPGTARKFLGRVQEAGVQSITGGSRPLERTTGNDLLDAAASTVGFIMGWFVPGGAGRMAEDVAGAAGRVAFQKLGTVASRLAGSPAGQVTAEQAMSMAPRIAKVLGANLHHVQNAIHAGTESGLWYGLHAGPQGIGLKDTATGFALGVGAYGVSAVTAPLIIARALKRLGVPEGSPPEEYIRAMHQSGIFFGTLSAGEAALAGETVGEVITRGIFGYGTGAIMAGTLQARQLEPVIRYFDDARTRTKLRKDGYQQIEDALGFTKNPGYEEFAKRFLETPTPKYRGTDIWVKGGPDGEKSMVISHATKENVTPRIVLQNFHYLWRKYAGAQAQAYSNLDNLLASATEGARAAAPQRPVGTPASMQIPPQPLLRPAPTPGEAPIQLPAPAAYQTPIQLPGPVRAQLPEDWAAEGWVVQREEGFDVATAPDGKEYQVTPENELIPYFRSPEVGVSELGLETFVDRLPGTTPNQKLRHTENMLTSISGQLEGLLAKHGVNHYGELPDRIKPNYLPLSRRLSDYQDAKIYLQQSISRQDVTPAIEDGKFIKHPWKAGSYGEIAEYVPVEILDRYRQFDRHPGDAMSQQDWNDLREDIRISGIREPLILEYHPGSQQALLKEGDHRLAIAKELGITELPVRIHLRFTPPTDVHGNPAPVVPNVGIIKGPITKPSQLFPELLPKATKPKKVGEKTQRISAEVRKYGNILDLSLAQQKVDEPHRALIVGMAQQLMQGAKTAGVEVELSIKQVEKFEDELTDSLLMSHGLKSGSEAYVAGKTAIRGTGNTYKIAIELLKSKQPIAQEVIHEFAEVWSTLWKDSNPQEFKETIDFLSSKGLEEGRAREFIPEVMTDYVLGGGGTSRDSHKIFERIAYKFRQWVQEVLKRLQYFKEKVWPHMPDNLKKQANSFAEGRWDLAFRQIKERPTHTSAYEYEDIRYSIKAGWAPTFYSPLRKKIEDSKQEIFTKEQALKLVSTGVKADELAWSGLGNWLAEYKGNKVTKQELLDQLIDLTLEKRILSDYVPVEANHFADIRLQEFQNAAKRTEVVQGITETMNRFQELYMTPAGVLPGSPEFKRRETWTENFDGLVNALDVISYPENNTVQGWQSSYEDAIDVVRTEIMTMDRAIGDKLVTLLRDGESLVEKYENLKLQGRALAKVVEDPKYQTYVTKGSPGIPGTYEESRFIWNPPGRAAAFILPMQLEEIRTILDRNPAGIVAYQDFNVLEPRFVIRHPSLGNLGTGPTPTEALDGFLNVWGRPHLMYVAKNYDELISGRDGEVRTKLEDLGFEIESLFVEGISVNVDISYRGETLMNAREFSSAVKGLADLASTAKSLVELKNSKWRDFADSISEILEDDRLRIEETPEVGAEWMIFKGRSDIRIAFGSTPIEALRDLKAYLKEEGRPGAFPTGLLRYVEEGEFPTLFEDPHWLGDRNVVGWTRSDAVQSPEGDLARLIEVQSGWHQKGRDKGYIFNRIPSGWTITLETITIPANLFFKKGLTLTKLQDLLPPERNLKVKEIPTGEVVVLDGPVDIARGKNASEALISLVAKHPYLKHLGMEEYLPGSLKGKEFWILRNQGGHIIDLVSLSNSRTEREAATTFIENSKVSGIPEAPFSKSWFEYFIKEKIRSAIEAGYNGIVWNTGEEQSQLWALTPIIDTLTWERKPTPIPIAKNIKNEIIKTQSLNYQDWRPYVYSVSGYKDGKNVLTKTSLFEDGLKELIGTQGLNLILAGTGRGEFYTPPDKKIEFIDTELNVWEVSYSDVVKLWDNLIIQENVDKGIFEVTYPPESEFFGSAPVVEAATKEDAQWFIDLRKERLKRLGFLFNPALQRDRTVGGSLKADGITFRWEGPRVVVTTKDGRNFYFPSVEQVQFAERIVAFFGRDNLPNTTKTLEEINNRHLGEGDTANFGTIRGEFLGARNESMMLQYGSWDKEGNYKATGMFKFLVKHLKDNDWGKIETIEYYKDHRTPESKLNITLKIDDRVPHKKYLATFKGARPPMRFASLEEALYTLNSSDFRQYGNMRYFVVPIDSRRRGEIDKHFKAVDRLESTNNRQYNTEDEAITSISLKLEHNYRAEQRLKEIRKYQMASAQTNRTLVMSDYVQKLLETDREKLDKAMEKAGLMLHRDEAAEPPNVAYMISPIGVGYVEEIAGIEGITAAPSWLEAMNNFIHHFPLEARFLETMQLRDEESLLLRDLKTRFNFENYRREIEQALQKDGISVVERDGPGLTPWTLWRTDLNQPMFEADTFQELISKAVDDLSDHTGSRQTFLEVAENFRQLLLSFRKPTIGDIRNLMELKISDERNLLKIGQSLEEDGVILFEEEDEFAIEEGAPEDTTFWSIDLEEEIWGDLGDDWRYRQSEEISTRDKLSAIVQLFNLPDFEELIYPRLVSTRKLIESWSPLAPRKISGEEIAIWLGQQEEVAVGSPLYEAFLADGFSIESAHGSFWLFIEDYDRFTDDQITRLEEESDDPELDSWAVAPTIGQLISRVYNTGDYDLPNTVAYISSKVMQEAPTRTPKVTNIEDITKEQFNLLEGAMEADAIIVEIQPGELYSAYREVPEGVEHREAVTIASANSVAGFIMQLRNNTDPREFPMTYQVLRDLGLDQDIPEALIADRDAVMKRSQAEKEAIETRKLPKEEGITTDILKRSGFIMETFPDEKSGEIRYRILIGAGPDDIPGELDTVGGMGGLEDALTRFEQSPHMDTVIRDLKQIHGDIPSQRPTHRAPIIRFSEKMKQDILGVGQPMFAIKDKGKKLDAVLGTYMGVEWESTTDPETKLVLDIQQKEKNKGISDLRKILKMKLRPQYKREIESILSEYDLKKRTKKKIKSLQETKNYLEKNPQAHMPKKVLDELERLDKVPLYELEHDEFMTVINAVRHFAKLNQTYNKLFFGRQQRSLDKAVDEANKLIRGNFRRLQPFETLSGEIDTLVRSRKADPHPSKKIVTVDSYLPEFLAQFLQGSEEGVISKLFYDDIDKGFTQKYEMWYQAQDMIREVIGDTKVGSWSRLFNTKLAGLKVEKVKLPGRDKPISITKAERMSIYLHSLNDYNRTSLLTGGFRFPHQEGVVHKIDEKGLRAIIESMTPEEKRIAEAMSDFLSNVQTKRINEVSLVLEGYEIANVTPYWPAYRSKIRRKGDPRERPLLRNFTHRVIENMGFTKERKAIQMPLLLRDAFDAFLMSINDATSYVAFAEPIRNARKLLEDEKFMSQLDNFGLRHWHSALETYLDDIEGSITRLTTMDTWTLQMLNKIHTAILGLNIGVILKQPTSYLGAAVDMDLKYLMESLPTRTAWKEVYQYSPQLRYRDEGKISREMGEIGEVGVPLHFYLGKTFLSSKFTSGILLFDKLTVGRIWNAVKLEVRDKYPDLEYESDKFFEKVARRTEQIVNRTQSTYLPHTRSTIGRSNSPWVRGLAPFHTQPNKNYNIMIREAWRFKNSDKEPKDVSRFFKMLFLMGLAVPVFLLGADEVRNRIFARKVDKSHLRTAIHLVSSTMSNVFVVGNLFDSIISKVEKGTWFGFEVISPFKATVGEFTNAITDVYNAIEAVVTKEEYVTGVKAGEKKWKTMVPAALNSFARVMGKFSGIPYHNVERTVKGIVKNIDPEAEFFVESLTRNPQASYYYQQLWDRIESGQYDKAASTMRILINEFEVTPGDLDRSYKGRDSLTSDDQRRARQIFRQVRGH